MKIGTLTFHRACNFGGVLQSYALVTYLKKQGYDAEIIDYISKPIEDAYPLIYCNSFISIVSSIKHLKQNLQKRRHFKAFRKRMTISSEAYRNPKEFKDIYDVIIIGSDQIWNKKINNGFDLAYWGNIPGKSRIVSYAASMGTSNNFTIEEYSKIKKYLENFYALSVREDSVAQEFSNLTDKSFTTVVDPTLLLHREDYENIACCKKGIIPNSYVLYYQMGYTIDSRDRVEEISKNLHCDVVVVGLKKDQYSVNSIHYDYSEVKVEEFVWLILHAKCVLASSFHGVALSIAMKKNFYFLQVYRTDRAMNLLKYINACDRAINPKDKVQYTDVDYSQVDIYLNEFIQKSTEYISTVAREYK
nr:polysaccharide pyruvyl transferase family protein [Bacteroidales bacterium]